MTQVRPLLMQRCEGEAEGSMAMMIQSMLDLPLQGRISLLHMW